MAFDDEDWDAEESDHDGGDEPAAMRGEHDGDAGDHGDDPGEREGSGSRVSVVDGHSMTVSVALDQGPAADAVVAALRAFRGRPQAERLPSAPDPPVVVHAEPHRPQPRLDADLGNGMTVSIGRVRPCPVASFKFFALGHNTVRGAAGGSILNAELMHVDGLL